MDDTRVKHGEKFIQDTQNKHSLSVCIFLILYTTYNLSCYYYTYIRKLTNLDPVAYQLTFTSIISFVGFFAFPPLRRSTLFKSHNESEETGDSYCLQDRPPSKVKSFWRRINRKFDDPVAISRLIAIVFAPIAMHLLNSLFIDIFNIEPDSFGNQKNLNEQVKSSSFVLAFLWIGFSAPIVEELFFRQIIIGFLAPKLATSVIGRSHITNERLAACVRLIFWCGFMVLSGLLFGLYHERHFNRIMAIYAINGTVLGIAYSAGKGRPISSIAPHSAFNIFFTHL